MVFLPSKSRVPFLISLFNFQGPIRYPQKLSLEDSSKSISHSSSFVNTFLKVFSKKFFDFFLVASLRSSLEKACLSYHFFKPLSTVFHNFFKNSASLRTLSRVFLCDYPLNIPNIGLSYPLRAFTLYIDKKKGDTPKEVSP